MSAADRHLGEHDLAGFFSGVDASTSPLAPLIGSTSTAVGSVTGWSIGVGFLPLMASLSRCPPSIAAFSSSPVTLWTPGTLTVNCFSVLVFLVRRLERGVGSGSPSALISAATLSGP
jgi:hypothetical protein